jgi:hypothetical protein
MFIYLIDSVTGELRPVKVKGVKNEFVTDKGMTKFYAGEKRSLIDLWLKQNVTGTEHNDWTPFENRAGLVDALTRERIELARKIMQLKNWELKQIRHYLVEPELNAST